MNLLMDALNKAEASRAPTPAGTRLGDLPHISMPVEPIRATLDDEDSGMGDGNQAPPMRADTPAAGSRSTVETGRALLGSHIGDLPHISMPVEPIRTPADGEEAVGGGDGRSPPMQADTPTAERRTFDAPVVPRRRGAGRAAGIALSVLAVTAGGAVGGHHVWKTELARPSLVRLPLPVSVAEVAPSWMSGVAASVAGESDAGAVAGPEGPPASSAVGTPAPGNPEGTRAASVPGVTGSGEGQGLRTPSTVAQRAVSPPGRPAGHGGSEPSVSVRPGSGSGVMSRSGSEAMSRKVMPPDDRDGAPGPPGRGSGSTPASWSVAQEDESIAGAMDSVPAGVAGHPPRTAQRARAIPRSEAGTATASRPTPGAGAVHPLDPGAGVAARPAPGVGIEIRKRMRPDRVAALLERAYGMFHSGDVESAAKAYRAVLGHEPHNRDAFLGLAAVVARAGRWDEAAAYYARILAFDPADAAAQAALIAIDERDPVRGESRLKALLSSEPRAAYLHFGLGNAYAAQSRWPEAQQSYFNAWRLDRGNADYAYNLAVSLDHLSRPESALDVYREALALAEKRPAGFEAAAVHARIRDLTAP